MTAAASGRTTCAGLMPGRFPPLPPDRSNHAPQGKDPAKASNSIRSERKGAAASTVVSSDSIASDLAAFRKAGGKIEVLGTTWALKKAS